MSSPAPQPSGGGGPVTTSSGVKHLIVVIMQNNSFDHLFGTFPGVNGLQPSDPGFSQLDAGGKSVTPSLLSNVNPVDMTHDTAYITSVDGGRMDKFAANGGDQAMGFYDNTIPGIDRLWSLAQQFALADNYFNSVMSSAPSDVLYMVAASDNSTLFPVQPVYGPCNHPNSVSKPYTFTNVGDQLSAKGVSWTWFHEQYGVCGNYVAAENPFQFFTSTQNSSHLQDYTNFTGQLQTANLPAISFVQPAPSHNMHPGSGSVSVGASWLANFVQSVQN